MNIFRKKSDIELAYRVLLRAQARAKDVESLRAPTAALHRAILAKARSEDAARRANIRALRLRVNALWQAVGEGDLPRFQKQLSSVSSLVHDHS